MKKLFTIILLSIGSFALITLMSARIERHFDGNDTYGFPLIFYTEFSGMCVDCPGVKSEINYLNLAADTGFAIIIGVLTWAVFSFLFNKIRR